MGQGSRGKGQGKTGRAATRDNPLVVTAAVIAKDRRILIARRKKGWRFAGKWEFPGGKIEPGETPEECLRRELREELGIEAKIGEFFCSSTYPYSHATVQLLVYRAYHVAGEYTLHDHQEIRWVLPTELAQYDFPEADKPVIEKLINEKSLSGFSRTSGSAEET
jgi:8-oxo-dGTP diphosphatase